MIFGGLGNGIDVPAGFSPAPQTLDLKWEPAEPNSGLSPFLGRGFVWCELLPPSQRRAAQPRPLVEDDKAVPWRLILGTRVSGGATGTQLVFLVGAKDGSTTEVKERLYRLDQAGKEDVCVDLRDNKAQSFGGYRFAEPDAAGTAIVIEDAAPDLTNGAFLADIAAFVAEVKSANP